MGNSCGCDGSSIDGASQMDVMSYSDALHAFQCRLSPDTKRRLYLDCVRTAIVSRRRERSFSVQPSWQEVDPTGVHQQQHHIDNNNNNNTNNFALASPMESAPVSSFMSGMESPPTFRPADRPNNNDGSSHHSTGGGRGGGPLDPISATDIIGCIQEHNLAPACSGRSGTTTATTTPQHPNSAATNNNTTSGGSVRSVTNPTIPIVTAAAASRLFKAGDLDRKRVPVEMEEVTYERIVAALVRACDELLIPHVLNAPASSPGLTSSSRSHHAQSSQSTTATSPLLSAGTSNNGGTGPAIAIPQTPKARLLRASWLATIENAVEFPAKLNRKTPTPAATTSSTTQAGGTQRKKQKKGTKSSGFSTSDDSSSGSGTDGNDGDEGYADFTTIGVAGGGVGSSKHDDGGGGDAATADVPTVRQYPSTTVEVAFYEPETHHNNNKKNQQHSTPAAPPSSLFNHLNSYFCSRPSLPTDHPLFRGLYRKQAFPADGEFVSGDGNMQPDSTSTGDASLDALLTAILESGSLPTSAAEDIGETTLEELLDSVRPAGGTSSHKGFEEQDLPYGVHLRKNIERSGSRPDILSSRAHLLDEGVLAAATLLAASPTSTDQQQQHGGANNNTTSSANNNNGTNNHHNPAAAAAGDLSSWVNQYLASVDLRHLVAWPPSACVKTPTVLTLPGSPYQVLSNHHQQQQKQPHQRGSPRSVDTEMADSSGGGGGPPGEGEEDVTVLIMFYHRRDRTQSGLKTNARETRDARKWSALTQEDEPRRLFRPMGHTTDAKRPIHVPGGERLPAAAPGQRGTASAGAAAIASDPSTQRVAFRLVKRSLQGSHNAEREDRRLAELANSIPNLSEILRGLISPAVRTLLFDDHVASSSGGGGTGGQSNPQSMLLSPNSSHGSPPSIDSRNTRLGGGGPTNSSFASSNAVLLAGTAGMDGVNLARVARFVKRLKTTVLKALFTAEPVTRLGWLLNSPYLLSTSQSSYLKRLALQQASTAELRGDAVEVVVEALCLHLRIQSPSSSTSTSAGSEKDGIIPNPIGIILSTHGANSAAELLHRNILQPLIPTEATLAAAIEAAFESNPNSALPSEQDEEMERLLFIHGRTQAAFKRLETRLQGGQGGGVDAASYRLQVQQQQQKAAVSGDKNNGNNPSSTTSKGNNGGGSSTAPSQPTPLAGCAMSSATTSSLRTSLAHPLALTGYLMQEEVWLRDLFELSST